MKVGISNVKSFVSQRISHQTLLFLLYFRGQRITEMEARLCQVSEQVMEQTELHHGATQRAQLAEQQFHDLRQRLQGVETELLTADMQRDRFRQSKQHVSKATCWHG